jgi:hypothetical protein
LAGLYTAIFAEPRYRLPIFMLLLPLSAITLGWLWQTGRALIRRTPDPAWKREAALAFGFATLVFAAAPALAWAGGKLREHHRWAVSECVVEGKPVFCRWRTLASAGALDGRPATQGVWNGVGLALPASAPGKNAAVTVETELVLAQGDYTVGSAIDLAPLGPTELDGSISFAANGQHLSPTVPLADVAGASREGYPLAWQAPLRHAGGPLRLRVAVSSTVQGSSPGRLWLNDLRIEPGIAPLPAPP